MFRASKENKPKNGQSCEQGVIMSDKIFLKDARTALSEEEVQRHSDVRGWARAHPPTSCQKADTSSQQYC